MTVKITLERNASSANKARALEKVIRELGARVTITGDVIAVNEGNDEKRVIDIVNRERVDYSRSK